MSEPVKCVNCGAVSCNDPGKTQLVCGACYTAATERAEKAERERDMWETRATGCGEQYQALEAANAVLREALEWAASRCTWVRDTGYDTCEDNSWAC